jgi:CRP/FNR family transcriptional regulator
MAATTLTKELPEQETHVVTLSSGDIACNLDCFCSSLLVVKKGCLRVYKRSEDGRMFTLYRVNAGECCSLTISCILHNTKFPATIEVEKDVVAHAISAFHVRKYLLENNKWQKYIFDQLSNKVTQLTDLTDNFVFNNMEARIANLLCRRLDRKYQISVVHATHQTIANEVGTSREVASRSLNLLESKGYLELKRGEIKILDFDALKNYSTLH